ncbi:rod shape-determining protein MreD [Litoribacter populi]|uniref:rod shape-determining protein MreD n=1 Tax=Litoribacter populi TaxID=2598460 RepID=UPI001180079C|nr:rod shape-determining protein MreD [Litoribacter populi]
MNSRTFILAILGFFAYMAVQAFVLKNVVIFGSAFAFLYVIYILIFPLEIKTIPLMLVSFLLGFSIDIFYDSLGMHTASLVLVAFLRKSWLKVHTPTGGFDDNTDPTVLNMGFGWFLTYALPLILIHHLAFFYIDNLGTDLYIPVIVKAVSSAVFTFILGVIVQMLFYKKKRGI